MKRVPEFSNDRLEFTMIINRALVNKKAQIDIIAEALSPASSSKYIIHQKFFKTNQEIFMYFFECKYYIYDRIAKQLVGENNKLPTQINIYMKLSIFDDENNLLAEKDCEDFYRIHFIRYMPDLMDLKKWYVAKNLQNIWFSSKKNDDFTKKNPGPLVDQIEWRWIMKFPEVAYEFLKLDKNQIALSYKIQGNIRTEIDKMIKFGCAELPTEEKRETKFGYFGNRYREIDERKKTKWTEDAPLFENFYHTNHDFNDWDLGQQYIQNFGADESLAAIGQFSFHVYATGTLKYISANKTEVYIESLVYYLWDRFNFTNDKGKPDECLGLWKIKDKDNGENDFTVYIPQITPDKTGKYEVTNNCYNSYRDDHQMGGDFVVYSTRHVKEIYDYNPSFIL
jgi:hypothetical protein